MAIERGIVVVDGSHLFASISQVWEDHPELKRRKLKIANFSNLQASIWGGNTGPLIRTIFYFKKYDTRLKTHLDIPSTSTPNAKNHWQINPCAISVDALPDSEIAKLSPKYQDQAHRREKGLDMELACDSLLLAANNKIDGVVFLVNDRDYIPLFKALQRAGANTYLISLDSKQPIRKELTELSDMYQTLDPHLYDIFGYTPPPVEVNNE